jgi:hypothetical protein
MKNSIVAGLLASISLLAGAQSASDTVTIPGRTRQIEAPAPDLIIPMQRDEFQQFAGAYTLSNGQTLYLRRVDRRYFARLDDLPEHQIVATASNAFVALDRQLQMRIDLEPYGKASGELLIAVPRANVADADSQQEIIRIAFR